MRAPLAADPRQWCREVVAVRVRRGWTQQQLADELEVNVRTVQRWENGKQDIHPAWMKLIRSLALQVAA